MHYGSSFGKSIKRGGSIGEADISKIKTEARKIEPPFLFLGVNQSYLALKPFSNSATCPAAKRAIGTRKGEQLT